jgi:hypothetical protein
MPTIGYDVFFSLFFTLIFSETSRFIPLPSELLPKIPLSLCAPSAGDEPGTDELGDLIAGTTNATAAPA